MTVITLHPTLDALPDNAETTQPGLRRFLFDRLCEDRLAAMRRRRAGSRPPRPVSERGLRLVNDLLDELQAGNLPDAVTLDLLFTSYGRHPEFRAEWSSAVRP